MEFIAQILQEGKALPQNVIKSYDKSYKNIDIPRSENMKGLIKKSMQVFKRINNKRVYSAQNLIGIYIVFPIIIFMTLVIFEVALFCKMLMLFII